MEPTNPYVQMAVWLIIIGALCAVVGLVKSRVTKVVAAMAIVILVVLTVGSYVVFKHQTEQRELLEKYYAERRESRVTPLDSTVTNVHTASPVGVTAQSAVTGAFYIIGPVRVRHPEGWKVERATQPTPPYTLEVRFAEPTTGYELFFHVMPADPARSPMTESFALQHEQGVRAQIAQTYQGTMLQAYSSQIVKVGVMPARRVEYTMSPPSSSHLPWTRTVGYYGLVRDQLVGMTYTLSTAQFDDLAPRFEALIGTVEESRGE